MLQRLCTKLTQNLIKCLRLERPNTEARTDKMTGGKTQMAQLSDGGTNERARAQTDGPAQCQH